MTDLLLVHTPKAPPVVTPRLARLLLRIVQEDEERQADEVDAA